MAEEPVLKGVDLSVEEGEMIALLGASGAGKSVLLRTITGLIYPDAGEVLINGKNVHNLRGKELAEVRNSIGMLFQNGALFDSMSVYENLAFPLREKTSLSRGEIEDRVFEHLARVEMQDAAEKYPSELSGGMQKRAALARTLVSSPEVIFFDEPTTGLDPLIGNSILRLIFNLHREYGFTAVIVTHSFQKVFQIVHKVAMVHNGELVAYTTPEEFMDSEIPVVETFVKEALEGPLEAISDGS